ncbi:MAG: arginase family protein, partial [Caldanaerobacter sp.]
MKDLNFIDTGKFLKADKNYEEADIIIVGIPMDYSVSFKPGTRFGPSSIRQASYGLETYSVYLKRRLEDKKMCDMGDLVLPYGNVQKSLELIEKTADKIIKDGKKGIF